MKQVVLSCAFATAACALGQQPSALVAATAWGPVTSGLRMSISQSTTTTDGAPLFDVTVENVGDRDLVLNLGIMLANGRVMLPEAVRLFLTDSRGETQELRYSDRRYGGIAGRVDDFIVALRVGSVYALRLSLNDYWSSKKIDFVSPLAPGRYRIQARFTGQGAQALNLDTPGIATFNFWEGQLDSNSQVFDAQ